MIVDFKSQTIAFDTHNRSKTSIGLFDTKSRDFSECILDDKPGRLRSGASGYFMTWQIAEGDVLIQARHLSDPKTVINLAIWGHERWEQPPETDVWSHLPRYLLIPALTVSGQGAVELVKMRGGFGADPLDWYHNWGLYDLMWQGIGDPIDFPQSDLVAFGIQRSSQVVFYDPSKRSPIRFLTLVSKSGKPNLVFRPGHKEAWTIDYEYLCVVGIDPAASSSSDFPEFPLVHSSKLQEPHQGMAAEFVGDLSFSEDERFCIVPRPFSGDVLVIDVNTRENLASVMVGGQPLEAGMFANGLVVARDWHSSKPLLGQYALP